MRHYQFGYLGAAVTLIFSRNGDFPCVKHHPTYYVGKRKRDRSSSPPSEDCWRRNLVGAGLLLLISFVQLQAQSESQPTVGTSLEQLRPDEPIDLPLEMLLRLNDTSNSVFTKKPIPEPEPLNEKTLGTINPQGKEGDIAIPLRGYPEPDQPPTTHRSLYAEGLIGLNTTATLRAGLSGNTWPFDYHASIGYLSSNGFLENNESSLFGATLAGGYVIGLGYGIFSGGYMGGEVDYAAQSYRLYAVPVSPKRSRTNWSLEGRGTASVAGVDLEGIARVRRFSVKETIPLLDERGPVPVPIPETHSVEETSVEGVLNGRMSALGFGWEGKLDLCLTNTTLGSLNYGDLEAGALFETPMLALCAGGSLSLGAGTDSTTTTRLAPRVELRFFPFDGLTLFGRATGGVRQMTNHELLRVNPYAMLDGPILPEDEKLGYEIGVHLEPAQSWGVRVAGARRDYASYLFFATPVQGKFGPNYSQAKVDIINGDFYVRLDSRNEFAGLVRYIDGTELPYVPQLDAEFFYTRRLFNIPMAVTGSVRYIGSRQGGTEDLDPVVLIEFEWSYNVAKILDLVLEARNLFSQDYQLWEGYEERGFYLAIGARTRL